MAMSHTLFEQRVKRIHELIESSDAEVKWNYRFPDPDNPDQLRQVDVSIKRDGKLTIVECRCHHDPQDTMWIEGLMGRRISLGADAVIAVSASGFTKGAKLKAARHGIILRDLQTIDDEEVRRWAEKRRITLDYIEFKTCTLRMAFEHLPKHPYVFSDGNGAPIVEWWPMFQRTIEALRRFDGNPRAQRGLEDGATAALQLVGPLRVNGALARGAELIAKIRKRSKVISLTSVAIYRNSLGQEEDPQATIETLRLGSTEVIEGANRASVVIDLSSLNLPSNAFFESVQCHFEAGLPEKISTSVIGHREAMKTDVQFQLSMVPLAAWRRTI
jgi:hypothetical protein